MNLFVFFFFVRVVSSFKIEFKINFAYKLVAIEEKKIKYNNIENGWWTIDSGVY